MRVYFQIGYIGMVYLQRVDQVNLYRILDSGPTTSMRVMKAVHYGREPVCNDFFVKLVFRARTQIEARIFPQPFTTRKTVERGGGSTIVKGRLSGCGGTKLGY